MKIIISRIWVVIVLLLTVKAAVAQDKNTTTIILLRHAEKTTDTSHQMKVDPNLSEAGKLRAQSLVLALKDFSPDIIYSTNYIRTNETVAPLAKKFNKDIEVYDPRQLEVFAESLKQLKGKIIVVAGHSNTTPKLVNHLIQENKYLPLDESVYSKIWIVTIKDGKVTEKQIDY